MKQKLLHILSFLGFVFILWIVGLVWFFIYSKSQLYSSLSTETQTALYTNPIHHIDQQQAELTQKKIEYIMSLLNITEKPQIPYTNKEIRLSESEINNFIAQNTTITGDIPLHINYSYEKDWTTHTFSIVEQLINTNFVELNTGNIIFNISSKQDNWYLNSSRKVKLYSLNNIIYGNFETILLNNNDIFLDINNEEAKNEIMSAFKNLNILWDLYNDIEIAKWLSSIKSIETKDKEIIITLY